MGFLEKLSQLVALFLLKQGSYAREPVFLIGYDKECPIFCTDFSRNYQIAILHEIYFLEQSGYLYYVLRRF